MNVIAMLAVEVLAVVATVLLLQLTVLLFRNPHRPTWFRSDLLQNAVVVALVAASCFSIGALAAGLAGAGIDVFTTLGLSAAVPLAVAFLSERVFGLRERLRRADAGESPFYAIDWNGVRKSAPRHG